MSQSISIPIISDTKILLARIEELKRQLVSEQFRNLCLNAEIRYLKQFEEKVKKDYGLDY